jgi:hypothetical protein
MNYKLKNSSSGLSLLGAAVLAGGLVLGLRAPARAQYVPGPQVGPGMMNGGPSQNNLSLPDNNNNNNQNQNQNPNSLPQTYDNNTLNYTIGYPSGWNYATQSDGTTVFRGPNNVTVTIASQTGNDLGSAVTNLKNTYRNNAASHAQISNEQTFNYNDSNGNTVSGQYFQVNYTDPSSNQNYQALVAIVPMNTNNSGGQGSGSSSGSQFLEFAYSAPAGQFGNYSSDAQAMFNSWTINQ